MKTMDSKIQNKTHEIYKTIHAIVASIYIIIVQTTYEISWAKFDFGNTLINIIISIAIDTLMYFILYRFVLFIYTIHWVHTNKDCYVAGRWKHIHTKEDDKGYVRCGDVIIKQHFYDIDVEAHNYQPVLNEDGSISYGDRSATHWRYILSELSDRGDITACYSTSKKAGPRRNNKGVHQLMALEHDKKGYPVIFDGDFADVYPSTAEGYIRLFKNESGKKGIIKRILKTDTSEKEKPFLEWEKNVKRVLKDREEVKN